MRRPLVPVALALAAGSVIARYVALPFPLLLLSVVIILAAVGLLARRRRYPSRAMTVTLMAVLVAAAAFAAGARRLPDHLAPFDGATVRIRGIVAAIPDRTENAVRFRLRVEDIALLSDQPVWPEGRHRRPARRSTVLVTVPRPEGEDAVPVLTPGRRVSVHGELVHPRPARNPGEYSQAAALAEQGIYHVLRAKGFGDVEISGGLGSLRPSESLLAFAFRLRHRLQNTISRGLGEGEEGAFVLGVLFGDRSGLSAEVQSAFVDAGVVHLLAVSGLHVGFIAAGLWFLLSFSGLSPRWQVALTAGGIFFYALMVGARASVLRAGVMAVTTLIGGIAGRERDGSNLLAAAAVVILSLDPGALFDIGFQLSFAATWGIVALHRRLAGWWGKLPTWLGLSLAVSVSAQLAVAPLSLFHFNRLSLVAPVANLVLVPVVGIIVAWGFATGVVGLLSTFLSSLMGGVLVVLVRGFLRAAGWFATWPLAAVSPGVPDPPAMAAFFLGIWLLLAEHPAAPREGGAVPRRETRLRVVAALLLLSTVAAGMAVPALWQPGVLRAYFVDVGQGDGIALVFPDGGVAVVDGGPPREADGVPGAMTNFLRYHRVRTIELLILTHTHADHYGEAFSLLKEIRVRAIVHPPWDQVPPSYKKLLELAGRRGTRVLAVQSGDPLPVGQGLTLQFLNPSPDLVGPLAPAAEPDRGARPGEESSDVNNRSLVFRVSFGSTSLLFTGDLERTGEAGLLARGLMVPSTVLKVGHHGSNTSSSEEFLRAVAPAAAVIQVGINRYGFPDPRVLDRLEAEGIAVFRTDLDGAIMVETDGKSVKVRTRLRNHGAEGPAPEEVEMQVKYLLAAFGTAVDQDPVTSVGNAELPRQLP